MMYAHFLKTSVFLYVIVLASSVLIANPTSSVSAQTENAKTYSAGDVHLGQSRVYIRVGKTGFGHEHAVEGKLKAGTFDLAGGSGELVFDMKSFDADTNQARQYIGLPGSTDAGTRTKVNANMQGKEILNVAQHPTAKFEVTSIKPVSQPSPRKLPQYQIEGKFTLHGRTNNIRFLADAEPKNGWVHVRGSFSILQTSYGIKPFSTALGAIGVANQLTIWGDLWVADKK